MKQTHAQNAVVSAIPQLTNAILATKIRKNESLSQFLTKYCTPLSSGKQRIYQSSKWECFSFLEENRPINEAHVLALMNSFVQDGYLLTILYVNEYLQIIDGQHRFEAARRLALPIYFMVMPTWGIREVTVLNVNSRNWTLYDFMASYAKAGNQNYVRFQAFCDKHNFEITTCQILLVGRRSGRRASSDQFRLGQMKVTEHQISDAERKAKKIADMQLFHPLGWKSRQFVEAMIILFGLAGYDHVSMINRLETHPDLLLVKARSLRIDEYLKIFVEKYNYRRTQGQISISI